MSITKGADWRQGQEVQLPSGHTALLRKPDVVNLIMADGEIPDVFTNQVMAGLNGQPTEENTMTVTPENLPALVGLMDTVAKACFVQPRIVDKPETEMGEDEIGLQHVSFADKSYIFQWALLEGQGQAAQSFPTGPMAGLAAVQAGEDIPPDAGEHPAAG